METSEDVYLQDDSMTTNVSKSSSRSSPSVRTQWKIAEKRMLVTEAKQLGVCPTARRHNMSSSTLYSWMKQDFGNVSKSSSRSSPSVHTQWKVAEKRMLVAEAKQWGVCLTARRHNMPFSTLRYWMMHFGDPGIRKGLPDRGRSLR